MIYKLHFGKSYNRLEFGFDKDYERIRIYKTKRELSKAIKRVNVTEKEILHDQRTCWIIRIY